MFNEIQIKTWRQFADVSIKFHPKLTILTGANGSGKTTILNLLNRHFGWTFRFIGTPEKDKATGLLRYVTGWWNAFFEKDNENSEHVVGKIVYTGGTSTRLTIPKQVDSVYDVGLPEQKAVKGFFIPSHRPTYKYQEVTSIPTSLINKMTAFYNYANTTRDRYIGNSASKESFHIKQTLISLASLGYGNAVVQRNDYAVGIFEGFENVLKKVLPPKLKFQKISVRLPEVVLETGSGDFPLDSVSGGVASIIDLAWQIYMFDDGANDFVVTLDEPENHLHPEMQKTLLPNFLLAFPRAQFIVATHNPFIISSEPNSNVFVLNYNSDNKVESLQLADFEKAGSANRILTEVLGLESTTPNWAVTRVNEILEKYLSSGVTKENIKKLKEELKGTGLESFIPDSISNLVDRSTNDKAQ